MEHKKLIKVLIVDDSHLMCKVLTDVLNSDPNIIVSGVAHNGKEAFELAQNLKPDIITMDIHMPVMDGIKATELIMAYIPTPILIITSSVAKPGQGIVFDAINNGALDFLEKKGLEYYSNKINRDLVVAKVRYLSGIRVITHPKGKTFLKGKKTEKVYAISGRLGEKIIAIASSTGGTEAILKLIMALPANLPCAIVMVQHLTSGFDLDFATWIDSKSALKVKIAKNSEAIKPGTVYLAPTDFQTRIGSNGKFVITEEMSVNGHCPSGDILLNSAAEVYKNKAIGVILTGMGKDGAVGIKEINDANGTTIAQDEKSCVIFGMPKAAIDLNAVDYVLSIDKIADKIIEIV